MKSGLPSAVRGAGAAMSTLPSALRGSPGVLQVQPLRAGRGGDERQAENTKGMTGDPHGEIIGGPRRRIQPPVK